MRVYANSGQFPVAHPAIQPPFWFELVRILSPDIFVAAKSYPVTYPACVDATDEPTDCTQHWILQFRCLWEYVPRRAYHQIQ